VISSAGSGSKRPYPTLLPHYELEYGALAAPLKAKLAAISAAHCGDSLEGDFIWSLCFTDLASGWTELRAVWNKGAHGVMAAVREMEARLPFALLGFDCDNGSKFLNHHFRRYFAERKEPVQFTRSRPYHKNDNAHVEQKNWTHVRCLLGYERLGQAELLEPINALYREAIVALSQSLLPLGQAGGKTPRRRAPDQAARPAQNSLPAAFGERSARGLQARRPGRGTWGAQSLCAQTPD
jgi:hypothetical protein